MKDNKTYLARLVYSIYIGVIMGAIITSVFLVVITNVDKYFFDSSLGISGDWLYYLSSLVLIPIFGFIYIYNKRIEIKEKTLILREKSLSFITSEMNIIDIKSISLHEQQGRRRVKKGIKFADGETAIMILTKPFSNSAVSLLIKDILKINSDIIIDEYYTNIMNSN